MPSDKLLLFHKQRRVTTSFDISASDAQPVRAMATRVSSARISNNLSTPRSPPTASEKKSGFPTPTAVAPRASMPGLRTNTTCVDGVDAAQ